MDMTLRVFVVAINRLRNKEIVNEVLPISGSDDDAGGVDSASSSNSTKNATKMFIPEIVIYYCC